MIIDKEQGFAFIDGFTTAITSFWIYIPVGVDVSDVNQTVFVFDRFMSHNKCSATQNVIKYAHIEIM